MTNEAYTLPEGYSVKAETAKRGSIRLYLVSNSDGPTEDWYICNYLIKTPEELPDVLREMVKFAEEREEGFRTDKARLAEVQNWLAQNVPGHK